MTLLPRLIRYRDVPKYLGMDRNRFNAEFEIHSPKFRSAYKELPSIGLNSMSVWINI